MSTIGVAIAVPEPYGSDLQSRRHGFGDPAAVLIPTHVTLLRPTQVADEALPEIVAHLQAVAAGAPAFAIRLRGTGTFRPVSRVVFVQVALGISFCERLEAAVRSGPLAGSTPFPYHPHVTVAHDIEPHQLDRAFDELAGYEAAFAVSSFGLYVHADDGVWRLRETFELTGEADQDDG